MGDQTKIEWTDATWNPIIGCTKVSAGCKFCYAEGVAARIHKMQPNLVQYQGVVDAAGRWSGVVNVAPDAVFLAPLRWRRPRRVFVNSMSDLFHPGVPDAVVDRVFAAMAARPQHTFQILTKRPDRMAAYLTASGVGYRIEDLYEEFFCPVCHGHAIGNECSCTRREMWDCETTWPLPNVWLGTSVEDQAAADLRVPALLECPAAVRFLSCEPLLGAVDLRTIRVASNISLDALTGGHTGHSGPSGDIQHLLDTLPKLPPRLPRINWVIVGGESGPGARPMHPDWVRGLRDQCVGAGVPFFFKQWGEWYPSGPPSSLDWRQRSEIREWFGDGTRMVRYGKKVAGRVLDGRVWDEMPEGRAS